MDKMSNGLMRRLAEIINFPPKPKSKGFRMWVLANQVYVLDRLYMQRAKDYGIWTPSLRRSSDFLVSRR